MTTPSRTALAIALAAAPLIAAPAGAQTAPAGDPAPAAEDAAAAPSGDEILVVATRLPGQVDAPQPPIATLDEQDIQALGASSLSDLLAKVAPQTASGRGRGSGQPVILVNGQRITNFREMRNFPPEAIRRVEILPEEVALRFGFPPDARVVNFILKDSFASRTVEGKLGVPTRGGFGTWGLEATRLRIKGPQRFSVTGTFDDTSPLTEAERHVVQTPASVPTLATDPDPAAFRSLIADSRNAALNLSWSRGLGKDGTGGSLSANGNVARTDSLSLSGLNLVDLVAPGGATARRALTGPLQRRSRTTTIAGGAGYNAFVGDWQLSSTLDASHADATTLIDRRADTAALVAAAAAGTLAITGPLPALPSAGQDRAASRTSSVANLTTLTGRPLRLPAGRVTTTIKAGYAWSGIDSEDTRAAAGTVALRRGDASLGVNVAVPLTSRREGFLPGAGDIALNFSAGYDHLSDFGGLTDWSTGLTWSPTARLGLQASYIVNDAAPTLAQLGNPRTQTLNVPVFDFTRGETVLATVTSGGNPDLRKERQRDLKLSANWQLPVLSNSNIVVEYFRNRSSDVTAAFPLLTPAIEAAFPGRVTRDASGRIVAVDQRPITFSRQDGSRMRLGFNLSGALGQASGAGGLPGLFGGGPPRGGAGGGGARGGGPRGGGAMAMFGGRGQGRWSFAVYDTIQFDSTVLVAAGGPRLDLLNGDALAASGTPRHTVEFNGGLFKSGLGGFVQGSWAAPTTVRSALAGGAGDLRFGSVAKVNLNLFADLGQRQGLVKAVPFFKGARISLRTENLFDARQRVTDAAGLVPLGYQPDFIDPRGRVISFELRKLF